MIVLVCGLSGSGKSTMIEALKAEDPSIVHIRASKLLSDAGNPTEYLSMIDASLNQHALVMLLKKELAAEDQFFLIDGHLLIETTTGPYLLPHDALTALKIDGIIYVAADVELLFHRRQGTSMEVSKEELVKLMALEATQARRLAQRQRIHYAHVKSGDIKNFRAELSNTLRG
jgi:adenylate kinase